MLVRKLRRHLEALVLLVFFISAASSSALPTLSVDVVPGNSTTEMITAVVLGDEITVDIVVAEVDGASAEALNGFEFDLLFDSSILAAVSISPGDFLLEPSVTVQQSVGVSSVELAQVTVGAIGATGAGRLATVVFSAVGLGIADLELMNVLLSQPFGVPLATEAINSGQIVVNVVPEPSTALLLFLGLTFLGGDARRQVLGWYR